MLESNEKFSIAVYEKEYSKYDEVVLWNIWESWKRHEQLCETLVIINWEKIQTQKTIKFVKVVSFAWLYTLKSYRIVKYFKKWMKFVLQLL